MTLTSTPVWGRGELGRDDDDQAGRVLRGQQLQARVSRTSNTFSVLQIV